MPTATLRKDLFKPCSRRRRLRPALNLRPHALRRIRIPLPMDAFSSSTFLLAFTALFSIVNPLSGAFIFFGATRELDHKVRAATARWVAIYSFIIVAASLYIGAYVLGFFGVSLPVLRVAGGIIVAAAGWRMLNAPDVTEQRRTGSPSTRSPCL